MPRLRRADPSRAGISRRRRGRGFSYHDPDGTRITDPTTLQRIADLSIPPAWTEVWICPWPTGHIQAIGTDAAGRRQYRYHDTWRTRRDRDKHDRMLEFAAALPSARRVVSAHLAERGLTRRRVLACAIRLLDLGLFRVGGESYADSHETYGLATLLREHVTIQGPVVGFAYPAKGGVFREQSVVDPPVRSVIAALLHRRDPGPELLAYRQRQGWHDVRSDEINQYLREITGGDYTAKDFRTWNATVLAAVGLAVARPVAGSPTAARRAVGQVVRDVARYLGNTPQVCRSSYVDPRVIERYLDGVTIIDDLDALGADPDAGGLATQGRIEAAVLDLLRGQRGRDTSRARLRRVG